MAMNVTAIVPSSKADKYGGAKVIATALTTFALHAQNELQKYPPAQPWKGPTPKSGLRKGGRRTGTLGRNWNISAKSATSVTVTNNVPYGSYVQGKKGVSGKAGGQTAVMAARGWPNVTDVGEKSLKETLDKIGTLLG